MGEIAGATRYSFARIKNKEDERISHIAMLSMLSRLMFILIGQKVLG